MNKSIFRPLMKFIVWLSGLGVLVAIADKLAGAVLKLHIFTGW